MDARKMSLIVFWGLLIGCLSLPYTPQGFTQESRAVAHATSGLAVAFVEPFTVIGQVIHLAGIVPEPSPEDQLLAVILPPRRLGFEQLRRALPYGTEHDAVIRYLTEDPQYIAEND